jgi:hypothetical protein
MVSAKYGARLSQEDLTELNAASEHLAAAAAAIQRANPIWSQSVVQLLILANNTVVRLHAKGTATFARYLSKRGMQKPQDATEEPSAAASSDASDSAAPGKPQEN